MSEMLGKTQHGGHILKDPNYNSASGLNNLFYEKGAYVIIKHNQGLDWALKKYLLNEEYYMRHFKLLSVLRLVEFVPHENEIFKNKDILQKLDEKVEIN